MAAAAAGRRAQAKADEERAEEEERERLIAAGILLPGEDWLIEQGPHKGHAVHSHEAHAGADFCQCGAFMGGPSYAGDWSSWAPPGPCPVCAARGIPLDGEAAP